MAYGILRKAEELATFPSRLLFTRKGFGSDLVISYLEYDDSRRYDHRYLNFAVFAYNRREHERKLARQVLVPLSVLQDLADCLTRYDPENPGRRDLGVLHEHEGCAIWVSVWQKDGDFYLTKGSVHGPRLLTSTVKIAKEQMPHFVEFIKLWCKRNLALIRLSAKGRREEQQRWLSWLSAERS